jgi:Carboxypeptidase regulatory-like domain
VLRGRTLAGILFFFAGGLRFPAWAAPGHKDDRFELRTVQGRVLTPEAVPASSAIVYLYDDRTHSVKTYITDKAGHYRFVGLFDLDDYEIHAESGGMISKSHTISSEDDRRDFVINLTLSHRK